MKCPNRQTIIEDWHRSRNGQPMRFSAHIAQCDQCSAIINEMEQLLRLSGKQTPPISADHLDADRRWNYINKSMNPTDRRIVEQHLLACKECREDVMLLIEAGSERAPSSPKWKPALFAGSYSLLGAAAAVVIMLLNPMQPNQSSISPVMVYGNKGGSAQNVDAALRAINPGDNDLEYAIAVWSKAREMNPSDRSIEARLDALKKRALKARNK